MTPESAAEVVQGHLTALSSELHLARAEVANFQAWLDAELTRRRARYGVSASDPEVEEPSHAYRDLTVGVTGSAGGPLKQCGPTHAGGQTF